MEPVQQFHFLTNWAAAHVDAAIFYCIAFLAIPLAYGVLFDPRIIRCGFLLIGVFGMISGLFWLLQAPFLAMAQLMIYAVGITLVIVIALMLTNPRLEHDITPTLPEHKLPGILVALSVFLTIYLALRSEAWQIKEAEPMAAQLNVEQIGLNLLQYYALPFEFASVLLLIALVGAIMLAKQDHPGRAEEWIDTSADEYGTERKEDVVKV